MLKKLSNIVLTQSHTIVGIDCCLVSENSYSFNVIILNKKNNNLTIKECHGNISSFEDLEKKLPDNVPVFLSIDGKGVLHKKLLLKNMQDKTAALQMMLPNAKSDDFLLQFNQADNESTFCSLIRMDKINALFNTIHNYKKINVVEFAIGPFLLNDIIGIFREKPEKLIIHGNEISINDHIVDIQKYPGEIKKSTYYIEDERIESDYLLAYSAIIHGFKSLKDAVIEDSPIRDIRDRFIFQKLCKGAGWIGSVLLLIILMINFIVFSSVSAKYNKIYIRYNNNKSSLITLDSLTNELSHKEKFVKSGGFLNTSKTSFYVDRIASLVPAKIMLTQINVQPLQSNMKTNEKVQVTNNKIIIKGYSANSISINDLIKGLKNEKWINNVSIIKYTKPDITTDAEFEISLDLKNN